MKHSIEWKKKRINGFKRYCNHAYPSSNESSMIKMKGWSPNKKRSDFVKNFLIEKIATPECNYQLSESKKCNLSEDPSEKVASS